MTTLKVSLYSRPISAIESELNHAPLSTLLRVAVADFRLVLRAPRRFTPNMQYYVIPDGHRGHGVCSVCLAGACLYIRLGTRNSFAEGLPEFAGKINDMRLGRLPLDRSIPNEVREDFLRIVQETYNDELDNGGAIFSTSGRAQLKTYLKAANYLEAKGL
jgi:hypothetical protein